MGIRQAVTECLVVTVFSTAQPPCFKEEKSQSQLCLCFLLCINASNSIIHQLAA